MKKASLFTLLISVCIAFACLFALPGASAAEPRSMEDAKAAMQTAMSYDGMSMRLTGSTSGLRSLWTIDHTTVTALQNEGYTVAYGVIMGVSKYDGNQIRPNPEALTEDLTVVPDANRGYRLADGVKNAALCVVYETGMPKYVTNTYTEISGQKKSFAFTTLFGGSYEDEVHYNLEMVYRGFFVLKKDGECEIGYVEMQHEQLPSSVSLKDLAKYFYTDYTGTNAKLYKENRLVLRVYALTGGATLLPKPEEEQTKGNYELLTKEGYHTTYKLAAGTAQGKGIKLTAGVPATGIYKITAKMNRENNYLGTIGTYRAPIGGEIAHTSEWRIGASGDVSTEAESGENAYLTSDASETAVLGYQYLVAGNNDIVLVTSGAVGLSDFALELMELPFDSENSMTKYTKREDLIQNGTIANKTTGKFENFMTYGIAFSGAASVSYTVTPQKNGIYEAAIVANVKNAAVEITVTDSMGNAQTVSDVYRSGVYPTTGGSAHCMYIPLTGELRLLAGESYTVTVGLKDDTGSVQMMDRVILQSVEKYDPNDNSYRVDLFDDGVTVSGGTNVQLLSDNKTYFIDKDAKVTFSVFASNEGMYGYRFLKAANGYRTKYNVTNNRDTYIKGGGSGTEKLIMYPSQIAGTGSKYEGTDYDSFIVNQAYFKKELSGDYDGYVWLCEGENELTYSFTDGVTSLGLASIALELISPYSAQEDIRIKFGETSDWVNGSSTATEGLDKIDGNNITGGYRLLPGAPDSSSVTIGFRVPTSSYYYVNAYAGAAADQNKQAQISFRITGVTDASFDQTVTYTHTERYMAMGGGSATAIEVHCTGAIYLEAGDYTVTAMPVTGWTNIFDMRLDKTGELEYVPPVSAACTTNGHIGYWYQPASGKYFSDDKGENEITLESTVIPADGTHRYSSWTVTADPTLYETGTMIRQCYGSCGVTESFTLPELSPLNEYSLYYEFGVDENGEARKGKQNTPTEGGHGWYRYKKDGQPFVFETDLPSLDEYYTTLDNTILVKAETLVGVGETATFDADSHTMVLNTPASDAATFTVNAEKAGFYSLFMKQNNENQKVKLTVTVTNTSMTDATINSPSFLPMSYKNDSKTYFVPEWEYNADFSTVPVSYIYLQKGENTVELKATAITSGAKLGISDLFLRAERTLEGIATETVVYPTKATSVNGWRIVEADLKDDKPENDYMKIPFSVTEDGTYTLYALMSSSGASVLLDSESESFPSVSLEVSGKSSGNSLGDQQKSMFYYEFGTLQLTKGSHTARFALKETENDLNEYLHIGLLAVVRTGDLIADESMHLDFDKKLDSESNTLDFTFNLSGLVPETRSQSMKLVVSGYYTKEDGTDEPFTHTFDKTAYNEIFTYTTAALTGDIYGVTYEIAVYDESGTRLLEKTEAQHYSIDDTLTILMLADLHYVGSNLTQYLRNYKYNVGDGKPASYQTRRYTLKSLNSYRTSYEAYGWTSDEKEQRVIDDIIRRYKAGEFDIVVFLGDQGMADGNYFNYAEDHTTYPSQSHYGKTIDDFWDSPLNLDYMMHVNYMSQLSAEGIPYIDVYGNHEYCLKYNEDKTDVTFAPWEELHHYQELFGHKDADGNYYDAEPNLFFCRVIRSAEDGKVKFVSSLSELELAAFKQKHAGDGNCYDYYVSEESVTDDDARLAGMLILSHYQFEDYDEYMREYVFEYDPATGERTGKSDYHAQTIRLNYVTENILDGMEPMLDSWGEIYAFAHNTSDTNGALSDLLVKHPNIQAAFMGDVHTETYDVAVGLVPRWVAGCWSVAYDADYYEERDPATGLTTGVKDKQYYYYKNGYVGHTIGGDYRSHPFAYMTLHIKGNESYVTREHPGFFYSNTEPQDQLYADRITGWDPLYVRAVDYTHEAGDTYTVGNHTVYVGGDAFVVGSTHINLASSYKPYAYNKPEYMLVLISGTTYHVCDLAMRPLDEDLNIAAKSGKPALTVEYTGANMTMEGTAVNTGTGAGAEGSTVTIAGKTYYNVSTSGGTVGHYLYDENGDFVYTDKNGNLVFYDFKTDANGDYIKRYFYEKVDDTTGEVSFYELGELTEVSEGVYAYTLKDGTYTDMWLCGDPMTVSALDSVTSDMARFYKVLSQFRTGKFLVTEGEITIENGVIVRGEGFMNFGYAYDLVYADGSLVDAEDMEIQQKETVTYSLKNPVYGKDALSKLPYANPQAGSAAEDKLEEIEAEYFNRTDNGLQPIYGYYQPSIIDAQYWIDR